MFIGGICWTRTKSLMFCAVSGGGVSLIQGSYEYFHYLQDGFDDSVLLFLCIMLASSIFLVTLIKNAEVLSDKQFRDCNRYVIESMWL